MVEGRDDVPHDHLEVLAHGATAEPEPGPVAEGADVSLKLVEIGRYDAHAGVGKVDGLAVVVAGGSNLIGKKVTARLERVMNGVAWATLLSPAPRIDDPITAESEAERPTRSRRRTPAKASVASPVVEDAVAAEQEEVVAEDVVDEEPADEEAVAAETIVDGEQPAAEGTTPKKKTRRGTRGGRNRRKKPAASVNGGAPEAEAAEAPADAAEEPAAPAKEPEAPAEEPAALAPARIHLPPDDLGEAGSANGAVTAEEAVEAVAAVDGEEQPKPKKRTRRGTRGGRNRKRKPAGAAAPVEPVAEQPAPE